MQEYGTMIHIVSGQLVCRMIVDGNCYKLVIVIALEEYKNDTTSLSRNAKNQLHIDAWSMCCKKGSYRYAAAKISPVDCVLSRHNNHTLGPQIRQYTKSPLKYLNFQFAITMNHHSENKTTKV